MLATLAVLLLAACGGSSGSSGASAGTSATSGSAPSAATGATTATSPASAAKAKAKAATPRAAVPSATAKANTKRLSALRECLRKNGGLGPGGVLGARSSAQQAKLRAALRKCGVNVPKAPLPRAAPNAKTTLTSSAFRKALVAFAVCMRQKGVRLAAPNTSGKGPVFDTRGVDTTSAKFKAAQAACAAELRARFKPKAGAGGAPSGSG